MTTTPNPQDDGGPAFPIQDAQTIHAWAAAKIVGITDTAARDAQYTLARAQAIGGMTLRDYFAAKALQGLLANNANEDEFASGDFRAVTDHYASIAFQYSDAMLRARQESSHDR